VIKQFSTDPRSKARECPAGLHGRESDRIPSENSPSQKHSVATSPKRASGKFSSTQSDPEQTWHEPLNFLIDCRDSPDICTRGLSNFRISAAPNFAVVAAGQLPVCALDLTAPDKPRFDMLIEAISCCYYSVHDLSRAKGEGTENFARMNMPLEMGLALYPALVSHRADHRCAFYRKSPRLQTLCQ
jgi:hypothetical protein